MKYEKALDLIKKNRGVISVAPLRFEPIPEAWLNAPPPEPTKEELFLKSLRQWLIAANRIGRDEGGFYWHSFLKPWLSLMTAFNAPDSLFEDVPNSVFWDRMARFYSERR